MFECEQDNINSQQQWCKGNNDNKQQRQQPLNYSKSFTHFQYFYCVIKKKKYSEITATKVLPGSICAYKACEKYKRFTYTFICICMIHNKPRIQKFNLEKHLTVLVCSMRSSSLACSFRSSFFIRFAYFYSNWIYKNTKCVSINHHHFKDPSEKTGKRGANTKTQRARAHTYSAAAAAAAARTVVILV